MGVVPKQAAVLAPQGCDKDNFIVLRRQTRGAQQTRMCKNPFSRLACELRGATLVKPARQELRSNGLYQCRWLTSGHVQRIWMVETPRRRPRDTWI